MRKSYSLGAVPSTQARTVEEALSPVSDRPCFDQQLEKKRRIRKIPNVGRLPIRRGKIWNISDVISIPEAGTVVWISFDLISE